MKKFTFAILTSSILFAACNKQDSTTLLPTEEPVSANLSGGRQCASDEVLQKQIAENPARAVYLEDLERKTENYIGRGLDTRGAGMLYVPVVVHVVLPNASQVTDAQIKSQIDVLNQDFNKTNTELSNTGVYLAGYSHASVPNCQVTYVVTNIVRKNSATATFGTNDEVKKSSTGGSDPVDATTKLNMWVCDLSSGYLGYAQFPGGSSSTDGVVIDYQAFGTNAATTYPMYSVFDLGRTATHEVGHWINLRHIWGDRRCGTDYVTDTPAHDASNGGCPAVGLKSACTGKPLEQWMNYMDYTDDRCMYMFSGGQKTRMDAAIDVSRKAYFLTTSPTSIL